MRKKRLQKASRMIVEKYGTSIAIVSVFFTFGQTFILIGVGINVFLSLGLFFFTFPLWYLLIATLTAKLCLSDFLEEMKKGNKNEKRS